MTEYGRLDSRNRCGGSEKTNEKVGSATHGTSLLVSRFFQKPIVFSNAGKARNRDSITSKVFERGGKRVRGKGGENFLRNVFPSLPPVFNH